MHGPGLSHTVFVMNVSDFLQLLLYHTPHSTLPLFLLLATYSAPLIRVQFLGYKRNLCNGPHSSSLKVAFCATAGGHTPR